MYLCKILHILISFNILIINITQELHIYDNDTIFAYRGQNMGDLDPHIYAVRNSFIYLLHVSFIIWFSIINARKGKNVFSVYMSGAPHTLSLLMSCHYYYPYNEMSVSFFYVCQFSSSSKMYDVRLIDLEFWRLATTTTKNLDPSNRFPDNDINCNMFTYVWHF